MLDNLFPVAGLVSIVCLPTGEAYIGYSKDITTGVQTIFDQLEAGRHRNPRFQEAFDDYGRDQFFVRIILESTDKAETDALKQSLLNSDQYSFNKSQDVKGVDPALVKDMVEIIRTPWGRFKSAYRAAIDAPTRLVDPGWVRRACFQPEAPITEADYRASAYLVTCHEPDVIGETWQSLGFGTSYCDSKTAEQIHQQRR
ncbi:hypothetical protein MZK49_05585 [Ensifer sesbaniae]|uniref:hypothetical protein n=1 Tax=Ensifer sesbaniae TaxID=1214071 RepID=UPI002000FDA6|nr:hypothetical protein [Ensifer sesbaniae]